MVISNERFERGHSIIELGCVAVLLVIVSMLCMDVGVVMLGSSTNERVCRDAARAAASGKDYNAALNLAQAAVKSHPVDGFFVSNVALNTASFVYQDYAGNPPPDTSPYVTVTTSASVRVPAPVLFGQGALFNPGDGHMVFYKTYTFPIVKTQLYLN